MTNRKKKQKCNANDFIPSHDHDPANNTNITLNKMLPAYNARLCGCNEKFGLPALRWFVAPVRFSLAMRSGQRSLV